MKAIVETVKIKPDYRNNGKYQFITGYTGGGNPMCVHLSFEEVAELLQKKHGNGTLIDEGTYLVWEQPAETGLPKLIEDSLMSSSL